jgi:hypothetical protein
MRVRIVSDGTPRTTQLQIGSPYRGGLGEERVHWAMVPGVLAIDWHLDISEQKAVAKITLRGVEVEVEAPEGTIETQSPLQKLFARTERPKPPPAPRRRRPLDTGQDQRN